MLQGRSSSVERGTVYGRAYVRARALAFVLCVSAWVGRARAAEPETAALVYERPTELDTCPDEDTFRHAVIARLGRDPFAAGAPRTIHVRLARAGAVLSAVVSVDEAGSARGERRIDTRAGCDELAAGAALAVSIAIDPLAALGPTDPSGPEPAHPAEETKATPLAPKPAVKHAPESPSPPRRATPLHVDSGVFLRAGGRAWLGAVPASSAGPTLGVGYRHERFSFELTALGVLPRSKEVSGTTRSVSVGIIGAELVPCAHFADFRACALFGSGTLLARGQGVTDPRTGTKADAWGGLAAGYSFTSGHFSLTPTAELAARFTSTELSLNSAGVWTTPRVFGSLGLELGYDFWR